MKHQLRNWLLFSIVSLLGASSALADKIAFFNTGLAADGSLLATGALDSHYSLIYNPDGVIENSTATAPNSVWMQNTGSAGWISPGASGNTSWTSGYYVYETTLDLTGYDPASAILTGAVAADNGISIYLNRVGSAIFSVDGFSGLSSFTINGGFVSGVNQVDFVVRNDGGPTGLLVDQTKATALSQVPEPAALLLVATGIGALYGGTRLLRHDRGQAIR